MIGFLFSQGNNQHAEIEFKNGKKNGKSIQWFQNGEKHIEAELKDNKYDGSYSSWWENGNLKEKGFYKK